MSKINEKENIYDPLIRNMQLMYKDFTFMFVPIIIGALWDCAETFRKQFK